MKDIEKNSNTRLIPHNFMYRPEIICLCGSTKFKKQFIEQQEKITMDGNIFLTVGFFGHADKKELTEDEKIFLDVLHLRKIELSDSILVINVNDYIGESTKREIKFAESLGKKIIYLERGNEK
jgi:hypothetical protein